MDHRSGWGCSESSDDTALPKPLFRFEKTPHYWAGWVAAYVQWRLALSFDELFRVMPYDELVARYHPWHEASEERFCELFAEVARDSEARVPTRLAVSRGALRLSQRELAHRSRVGLRSIQMYEQRRKDINKAQAQTLQSLARVLHCAIEDLLEPVFTLDEVV
ncbi:helix-turn-helix transcriptional regulator [Collinsella sp. An268]|uniref:helix-turn-helix domain-containing protein n=1 Tax=Collinsella sp. An268 TaxID=1965612 RepID=UPI000B38BF36|nr:helix-turn-helix transcriptional regulator [Collinsella sp. An268]OUO64218.1 hypothetical protein B5F70_06400 [Collinsella sp. An268]